MTAEAMTAATALIAALAALIWPLIAIGALLAFRGPAMRALNRISQDGGTVEVFGVRIDVGKATEEQQALIEDLQQQVKLLRDAVGLDRTFVPIVGPVVSEPPDAFGAPPDVRPAIAASPPPPPRRAHPRVLWVDNHPENNAVLVASLNNRGFEIEQVVSTAQALDRFTPERFDAVVSDMGRHGERDAGVVLTRAIRALGPTPVLIFCSEDAARTCRTDAMAAGANVVTGSATVLMDNLRDLQAG